MFLTYTRISFQSGNFISFGLLGKTVNMKSLEKTTPTDHPFQHDRSKNMNTVEFVISNFPGLQDPLLHEKASCDDLEANLDVVNISKDPVFGLRAFDGIGKEVESCGHHSALGWKGWQKEMAGHKRTQRDTVF